MPPHPLVGAEFRAYWASKRLYELRDRINRLLDSDDDRIIPAIDGDEDGEKIVIGLTQLKPPPLDLSTRAGEVIYHLRSALDYLVYALSVYDNRKPHPKAQFPITFSPEAFESCREGFLAGVSDAHVTLFKPYQPCFGCDWTRTLHALSNPDKHRSLIVVTSRAQQTIVISQSGDHWVPGGDDFDAILRAKLADGTDVHVKFNLTTQITFDDGAPIIETMEVLHSQIAKTIETFKPEFEGVHSGRPVVDQ